jgi:ubiquitin C-terminal hydrolase
VITYTQKGAIHMVDIHGAATKEDSEDFETLMAVIMSKVPESDDDILVTSTNGPQVSSLQSAASARSSIHVPTNAIRQLPPSVATTSQTSRAQKHFDAQSPVKKSGELGTTRATTTFGAGLGLESKLDKTVSSRQKENTSNVNTSATSSPHKSTTWLTTNRPSHGLAPTSPSNYQTSDGRLRISQNPKESPTTTTTGVSKASLTPFLSRPSVPSPFSTHSTSSSSSSSTINATSNTSNTTTSEYTGIRNTGNTCYINAVLQALMSLGSFVSDLGHHQLSEITKDIDLRSFYRAFLAIADQTLQSGRKTALDPSRVKLAVARHSERFRDNQQQDAHEFLISCLSQLELDLMPYLNEARKKQQMEALLAHVKPKRKQRSSKTKKTKITKEEEDDDDDGLITDTELGPNVDDGIAFSERKTMLCPSKRNFAGVLKSTLICPDCEDVSYNYESIRCLTLDVFDTTEKMVSHLISNMRGPSNQPVPDEDNIEEELRKQYSAPVTIETLISIYFSNEKIERTCEKCQCKESILSRAFVQLPRVLVIHLKRFSFDYTTGRYSKLGYPIQVSKTLNLKHWCDDDTQCAGPVAFNSDTPGLLQRSKSRIESLAEEEDKLKEILQKDRAARKRKRTTSPSSNGNLEASSSLNCTEPSKPSMRSRSTAMDITDSKTSISIGGSIASHIKPKSIASRSSQQSHNPSKGLYDESSDAYQDVLQDALDFKPTVPTIGSRESRLQRIRESTQQYHKELDENDEEEPKAKKSKLVDELDDGYGTIDINIPFDPKLYKHRHVMMNDESDHAGDESTVSEPETEEAAAAEEEESFDPNSLPDAFNGDFESHQFAPPAANSEPGGGLKGGSSKSVIPSSASWRHHHMLNRPYGGLKGGTLTNNGSGGGDIQKRVKNILGTFDGDDDEDLDTLNANRDDLLHNVDEVDYDKMSEKEKVMWECARAQLDGRGGGGYVWPIPPSMQSPLPSLQPSKPWEQQNTRPPINSSSSSSSSTNTSTTRPSLAPTNSGLSRAANIRASTTPKPSDPIDLDEDDDLLTRIMAESKASYAKETAEKENEADFQRLLKETAPPVNDYDIADLFDSGDEEKPIAYPKDEYEGDEVAPLSNKFSEKTIDPPRPPTSYGYSLQAVVHHLGLSANAGHYVADVCSDLTKRSSSSASHSGAAHSSNSWKTFDDARVTPTTAESVFEKTTTPYMLFYVHDSAVLLK